MESEKVKRIEWIDIFKALVIISVVVGHTTGKYNMFIYQFHMAAFFFISGYVSHLDKRTIEETIWNKICTIILPLVSVFIVMLGVVGFIDKIGLYNVLFEGTFLGVGFIFKEFVFKNSMNINWLGATWFLTVLFSVYILQRILLKLARDQFNLFYGVSSAFIFIIGYYWIEREIQFGNLDLAFIAQFYFFLGVMANSTNVLNKVKNNKIFNWIFLVISTIGLWYFGCIKINVVDYPSRQFGFIFSNLLAAINGIIFIYCISILLEAIPKIIKKYILLIGKSTLGIVFFHFLMFKCCFWFMYIIGIVPLEYLKNFIPTTEIGEEFWVIIAGCSLILSTVLWNGLNKLRIARILLGQEKEIYNSVYENIKQIKVINSIKSVKLIIPSIDDMKKSRYVDIIKNHKMLTVSLVVIMALMAKPILLTGIMCNDELQTRLYAMGGAKNLFKYYISGSIQQGRVLSAIPVSIYFYLQFFSSNILIFRTMAILFVIIDIALFTYIINKIFGDKKFSVFLGIMLFSFLNINFEHTVPNTFVGFLGIPFAIFLLSIIFYIKFIQNKRTREAIIYSVLLFLSLISYEAIITLMPMFPLIAWYFSTKESKNIKGLIKKIWLPIAISVSYLVIYIISSKLAPSMYEGNQLTFISFKDSFDIIVQLFKSSIPGYYLFNKKYQYLTNLLTGKNLQMNINLLSELMNSSTGFIISICIVGSNIIKSIIDNLINLRILISSLMLIGVLNYLISSKRSNDIVYRIKLKFKDGLIVFIGIIFMILPTLPIALSKMYQGNVNADNFIALPVSYFSYFASIFTISYMIYRICTNLKNKKIIVAIICLLVVYLVPIQAMNDVFSKEINKQYERLTTIESIFNTNTMKSFQYQKITAEDFFKTKNALAIHDSYWNDFSNMKGISVEILNEKKNDNTINIYYQNDDYFILSFKDKIRVLSSKPIIEKQPIKVTDTEYLEGEFTNYIIDKEFYAYDFIYSIENRKLIPISSEESFCNEIYKDVGSDLNSCEKITGYYNDGWVEKYSEFRLSTGELGKVKIQFYYPDQITNNLSGKIYINNEPTNFKITENNSIIILDTDSNETVDIKIECDFERQASQEDERMVSILLVEIQGE